MAKVLLVCLSVLVGGASLEPTTHQYVSYNSSDLSYLSNGIQFPVPATLHHESIKTTMENSVPLLQWMANLYSHYGWVDKLAKVVPKCREDMLVYLGELKNGTLWASKMNDASGRYNSHFFYGNDFWLGSKSQCTELTNSATNEVIPPFPLQFYVAKVRINVNEIFTPVTRQITIGECLPKSCEATDVRTIFLQEQSQAKSLMVVDIRPVPGDYSIYYDRKFHIVGGTALSVAVLIVIASFLEVFTKTRVQDDDEEIQNNNVGDVKSKDKEKKDGVRFGKRLQMLLAFSAVSNGKKILDMRKTQEDAINCIHGMRFFSIAWIIMVHTYLEVFSIAENKTMRTVTERSLLYQTVSNGTFSVDTFFFISGLLVTILFFRSAAKTPPKEDERSLRVVQRSSMKFFMMLFYRYLRLTPPYLFAIGVNELVLRYTHSHSVYSPAIIDQITCDQFWWRNALYINNFYPQHEFCMLWSWYMANDTQFYIIAAAMLLVAVRGAKHVRWVGASIAVFLLMSWVTTFVIAMKFNYVARVEEPFALFDLLYDKPWLRIGPYLIGMMTGYFLFKYDTPRHLNGMVIALGWVLSLACLTSLVYGTGRSGLVVPVSAVYASLGHTAWGLALAWITVACCWGYGGPINTLLSFRGFLPLSRLTYCAYLIHPVLMVFTSFQMDGPIHLDQYHVLIVFLGNAVVSFILAFLISLAFEAPVIRLLKILLAPNPKKK